VSYLATPITPSRSCSCVLPDDTGSSSGWHTREIGDQGCFEVGAGSEKRSPDGSVEYTCNRGTGRHCCINSGERCLYSGTIAAVEPCPRYRAACAVDAIRKAEDRAA
jgi:hypothetical protein